MRRDQVWVPLLFLAVVLFLPRAGTLGTPEETYTTLTWVSMDEVPSPAESALRSALSLGILGLVPGFFTRPDYGYYVVALLAAYAFMVLAVRVRPRPGEVLGHCAAFAGAVAVLSAGNDVAGRGSPVVLLAGIVLVAVSGWCVRRADGLSWWHYPLVAGGCLVVLALFRVLALLQPPGAEVVAFAVLLLLACAVRTVWLWSVAALFLVASGLYYQAPGLSVLLSTGLLAGAASVALVRAKAGGPEPTRLR